MRRFALLTVVTAAAVACGGDGERRPGATVRDSAGVLIVENTAPAWRAGAGWQMSEEALVEIGVTEGAPAYQLYRARSAVRLSDGRVVIANGGTNELRFYDNTGTHLFSAGRSGEGPGEFRDLQRVWLLPGDSLMAYDFGPSRLSIFSPTGDFVRALHIASPDGRQVLVRGPVDDRSVIVAGAPIWAREGATAGVVRDSVPYYRYDAEGSLLDTLGVFPSAEVFRMARGDGWRLTGLPFARVPTASIAGDRFHFGPADSYEIHTYTLEGRLERVIRLSNGRQPVTAEDVTRFRNERLERAEREGTRPSMERILAELPYPDEMPPYERVVEDADGNLWVADYRADPDEDRTWKVFSPDGSLMGAVAMQPQFEALQIGSDFVLGYRLDELEVERIAIHALTKQ